MPASPGSELPLRHVSLRGHLEAAALRAALATVDVSAPCALVVDALEMTGYDAAARDAFIDWNRKQREVILRVAVITRRVTWRAVIAAMALASRQKIQAFATVAEGERWAARGLS